MLSSSGLPRLRGMLRASGMGAKALMLGRGARVPSPLAVVTRRRPTLVALGGCAASVGHRGVVSAVV